MKKIYLLFFLISCGIATQAQTADRQTISSGGMYNTLADGTSFQSTIGETVISTLSTGTVTLTQGFQQPEVFDQSVFPTVLTAMLYPNPAVDQVKIDFEVDRSGKVTFTLIDNSGRMIDRRTGTFLAGKNQYVFPINTASGLYLLVINHSNNKQTALKLVVE